MTDDPDRSLRRWAHWPLRLAALPAAVLALDQPVFAGQFLAGDFGGLDRHRTNATAVGLLVLCELAGAVLLRWPGRGPAWPIAACAGLFGLVGAQIALGYARVLAVHVPLGVLIVLGVLLLTGWSLRRRPGEWWPALPLHRRRGDDAATTVGRR